MDSMGPRINTGNDFGGKVRYGGLDYVSGRNGEKRAILCLFWRWSFFSFMLKREIWRMREQRKQSCLLEFWFQQMGECCGHFT